MASEADIILFVVFAVLLVVDMPIGMSTAASSIETSLLVIPSETTTFTSAQKMVSSLNSFSLVVIPFLIFSGVIVNNGGIAQKLVSFSMLLVDRVPSALAHTNMLGNALFGLISSSATAVSTAIGDVLILQQANEGYNRKFTTAVNIVSAPTGMAIPPSAASIMYSLMAGGASISSLFLGGYLVGFLWVLGIIVVVYVIAKRHSYPTVTKAKEGEVSKVLREVTPSVLLVAIIVDGILAGLFTAIEVSTIAVVYSLSTSMLYYKTVKINDLPKTLEEVVLMSGTIMFLLATSSMMSLVMTFTGIPEAISTAILGIADNKYLILLSVNAVLLLVGMFTNVGLAILIFTPISLPTVMDAGVDPVHFGLSAIVNLCVGSITLPVGTGLYVGASVGGAKAEQMLKPLVPFYLVVLVTLLLITYVPKPVVWLPSLIL